MRAKRNLIYGERQREVEWRSERVRCPVIVSQSVDRDRSHLRARYSDDPPLLLRGNEAEQVHEEKTAMMASKDTADEECRVKGSGAIP